MTSWAPLSPQLHKDGTATVCNRPVCALSRSCSVDACRARSGDVFHAVSTRLSAEWVDALVRVCRQVSALWSRHPTTIALPHWTEPWRRQRLSTTHRLRGTQFHTTLWTEKHQKCFCHIFYKTRPILIKFGIHVFLIEFAITWCQSKKSCVFLVSKIKVNK